MNLSISMYSYFRLYRAGEMDMPQFIREAARIGVDGVELLHSFYKSPEDRDAAKAALEETELPCPIFSVSQNFAKPDANERREQLEKIKAGIGEALFYSSGVVRVFAGDTAPGMTFDDARSWIIEGLSEASRYAAEHGVKLALENHGKLAGRGNQVREIIDEVADRSGSNALGANPDTGNFLLVNQPSHEAIAQVAGMANMVHFKDFAPAPKDWEGFAYEALNGDRFVGTAVGEGVVDLAACVKELKDAGFKGWLSIEYEGEEDPITAAARSVTNSRKYL